MTAPIVSKQQKELKNWLKLPEKCTAAVAAKPMKHGKKSSTYTPHEAFRAVLSLTLADDHRWLISQGRSSGRMYRHSPRALSKGEQDGRSGVPHEQDSISAVLGQRHEDGTPLGGALLKGCRCHRILSPNGCDGLEAGQYITLSTGGR
jgi:hypothetical protein